MFLGGYLLIRKTFGLVYLQKVFHILIVSIFYANKPTKESLKKYNLLRKPSFGG